MKKENGITLVTLVITIILLLILAGVVINLVLGENGILNRAKTAGEEYTKASIKEEIELGIADIGAELASKTPPEGITNQAIIDKLVDTMQEVIIIENDLTGEYKGYEYWIDEKYEVHIGNKVNKNMQVRLQNDYVGTSSTTVSVNASSTEGEIQGYVYSINGEEKEQTTQETYTFDNLVPETEYSIRVTAIDVAGNKKGSNIVKIKTEARTYLYNRGDQCSSLTGGWQYTGYDVNAWGSVVFYEDYIALNIGAKYSRVYCGTKNKIDISPYSKICVNVDGYIQQVISNIGYFNNQGTGYGIDLVTSTSFDISKYNQSVYYHLTYPNSSSTTKIYQVWLEK